MELLDLIHRTTPPAPWSEGDNIPWNEPGFSERMLKEHLSQAHDAASRRATIIDQHVAWIHRVVLAGQPARILDLGCGPGLYTSRLARLGHQCVGIDFSPASVAYATAQAQQASLACHYQQQDLRTADYGGGFDLVQLIFGEFNVFSPADIRRILRQAHRALKGGAQLLLEPHTFAAVQGIGTSAPNWYTAESGLFSEAPHLCLEESFWEAQQHVATKRFYIVDSTTGQVTRYAASYQAYTEEEYRLVLKECGFEPEHLYTSLAELDPASGLLAVTARKRDAA